MNDPMTIDRQNEESAIDIGLGEMMGIVIPQSESGTK